MTEALHDPSRMSTPLDERIGTVLGELELAIRWGTACVVFAVYGSDFVRLEAESLMGDQLAGLNQEIVHIRLKSGQSSLFEYLNSARVHEGIIFFIEGLRWGQCDDEGFYESLSRRRELFRQAGIRAVIWVTESELLDLARRAAEFWACRDRIIEFLDTPTSAQIVRRALDAAWQAAGEPALESDNADGGVAQTASMLASLPDDAETGSGRAGMLLTLGLLNWRQGDFHRADEQLSEALHLAQEAEDADFEAECLHAVGLLHGSTERVDEAISAYKQAIRLAPGRIPVWNNLGSLCSRIGRNDEALVAFQKAIECNAEDAIAWNGLGCAYHRIGYSEDAAQAFEKSTQYMPSYAQPWNGLGDVYASSGRAEEAVQAYQRAITLDRRFVLPWLRLGDLFTRQDRWRDAVRAYQRALALEPSASTWNQLGLVYLESRAWQDAEEAFMKAIELDPECGGAHSNLGLAFSRQGQCSQAIPLLLHSIDLFTGASDKAAAWNRLGDVYRQTHEYENALAAYQMADSLDPQARPAPAPSPAAASETTPAELPAEPIAEMTSAGISEPPAALPAAAPAPEQQPAAGDSGTSDAPYWIFEKDLTPPMPERPLQVSGELPMHETGGTAMPNLESANFPEAAPQPLPAAMLDPELSAQDRPENASPFAWNEKGNVHFRQGAYDQAIAAYNHAIELDPAFGWPYGNLALCYMAQGQHAQAIELYKRSIELLGSDADKAVSWNGLGNVYRAMGDYANAVAAYQKAGEMDPRTAGMREGIQTLQVGPGRESAQVMNDLGEIFLKSGVYSEAANAFQRAITLDPGFGWPYSNLARTLAMQGHHEQAIPLYLKSIELMSDRKDQAVSWNRLGNSYRRLNDYDNAIKAFREAVALNDEGVNLVTRARFSLLSNCCVD